MRKITKIVQHYSATYPDQDIGRAEIDHWHRRRGFNGIGYHYVIRRDGTVERGRSESQVGAHVAGHNADSIGICLVGGLERATGPNVGIDNRTTAQIRAQVELTRELLARYPGAEVIGHRDLAATQCPGYDARKWWTEASKAQIIYKPAPVERQDSPDAAQFAVGAAFALTLAAAAFFILN